MIPIQILRVLSTIQRFDVPALLMGGQACVLYGAAEYSRDLDLVVLATDEMLPRLRSAMTALGATVIAVPQFDHHASEEQASFWLGASLGGVSS